MDFDFNEMSSADLHGLFFDAIAYNYGNDITGILANTDARKKLELEGMFIGLINCAYLGRTNMFNNIHNAMLEDGKDFDRDVFEKIFNASCQSKGFEFLKELDKKFNFSSGMMIDSLYIDEAEIIKEDFSPDFLGNRHYDTYAEQIKESWKEHGFITACKDGNTKLVEYLLSVPTVMTVPLKLIEAGFIVAAKTDHYDTAMTIYPRIGGIDNSLFIKEYFVAPTYIEERDAKEFLSKLMFKEQMEQELPENTKPVKKNKI